MNQKIVNCPHSGKILPKDLWEEKNSINQKTVKCPWCGSTRNWKDGKRKVPSGDIQRYFCRECAFRFSYST